MKLDFMLNEVSEKVETKMQRQGNLIHHRIELGIALKIRGLGELTGGTLVMGLGIKKICMKPSLQ